MIVQNSDLKLKLRAFLNNATSVQQKTDVDLLSLILRETVEKPVIYLGTSTCGMVAGAGKTLQAIKNYLSEKEINAEVVEVGCIGLCSVEPVLDVQLPGRARISFQRVTAEKVDYILDGILNKELPVEDVLYQYPQTKSEPWPKVPFINQVPFFANQNRIVLKNCGIINPEDIVEYIAGGGYRAFVKTIRNYTSEKVVPLSKSRGLKGRGVVEDILPALNGKQLLPQLMTKSL